MEKDKVKTIQRNPDCIVCGQEKTLLIRIADDGKLTQNTTKVCTNPDCALYINLEKVTNWKARK